MRTIRQTGGQATHRRVDTETNTLPVMTVDKIISAIDDEIALLQQVRALLSTDGTKKTTTTPGTPKKRKRKLSAAARKRIGDAQRKRWAAQKKATA